jgi:hypothetical protein
MGNLRREGLPASGRTFDPHRPEARMPILRGMGPYSLSHDLAIYGAQIVLLFDMPVVSASQKRR